MSTDCCRGYGIFFSPYTNTLLASKGKLLAGEQYYGHSAFLLFVPVLVASVHSVSSDMAKNHTANYNGV